MHVAFFVICGLLDDFSFGVVDFFLFFLLCLVFVLDVFDVICLMNRIAYCRLRGLALLDCFDIVYNSVSGCMLRCCGLMYDVRLFCSYEVYMMLCFRFSFCICGDAFDRLLIRLYDMRYALVICKQCLLFFVLSGWLQEFYMFNLDILIETIIYIFFMC